MKIASTSARYLLGVIFLTFGLNGFLNFIPMPPPPPILWILVVSSVWPGFKGILQR